MVELLPSSYYVVMCVGTRRLDQRVVVAVLECLCAAYRHHLIIESDQGTHFTGVLAGNMQIDWKFHVAYHSQGARIIELYNFIAQ